MKAITTDGHHIPEPTKQFNYWVLWDFQIKQPLAPWLNGHCYPSDWRQDSDTNPRTNYDHAKASASLEPRKLDETHPFPEEPPERIGATILLPHEGEDTPGPQPADPPLLFIDYDDVVVDGEIPSEVWETAKEIGGPLFVSRSFLYGDEPAGLHQLARGSLPGTVTMVEAPFENRGHIEIYYRSRMTGFTWKHVRGTPTDELPDASEAVSEVIETLGKESTQRKAQLDPTETHTPDTLDDLTPREELDKMDTTDDMDDILSAIKHTQASDIRLQSTLTEETGVRKSYDPSWEHSASGTRLGYDTINGREMWIYRRANHPVDALQVVAREKGIISDITDYPDGSEFWKAVQALRERGATIPYYEGENGTHPDVLRLYEEPEDTDDAIRQVLREARASQT